MNSQPAGAGRASANDEEIRPSTDHAVVEIPIASLAPDPFQPRTVFSDAAVRELADSIEQHGILQPLLVRPMQGPNSRGKYWIVGGERRYRAAQLLGMVHLPCRIRSYENMAAAVVALAENVHREDLSELDKAEALLRIKTLTDRTWDDVAELVKLSRDYVKRLAGLIRLEPEVQALVRSGQISVRTAIALRPLAARKQLEMAHRVVNEGLTAEQVRHEVGRHKTPRGGERAPAPDQPSTASGLNRTGSTRALLAEYAGLVRDMDEWLDEREWSPSRISESQRTELEGLYAAVSLLQQQLATLRRGLRTDEPSAADKLRKADLPF